MKFNVNKLSMFFRYLLKILTKRIVKKYRPLAIGITGSFNKTSAAAAIYTIVKQRYDKVRLSQEMTDYQLSIFLAIVGLRKEINWLKLFYQAIRLIIKEDKNYPNILVLEIGATRFGEIAELVEIIPFDIGVITGILAEQLGHFGTLENLVKEKLSLVKYFEDQSKIAVLNGDEPALKGLKNQLKARVYTYGHLAENDYQLTDKRIIEKGGVFGTIFKLHYRGRTVPIFLPNIFGLQVEACFSALVFADVLYSNILEAIDALYLYRPTLGRTNLISGIKNSLLIDDSYDSTPLSVKAALEVLKGLPISLGVKRIAVLGEILGLGSETEKRHQEIGEAAVVSGVEMLVAVGEKARDILRGAISAGLPEEKTFYFENNREAGIFVQNKIHPGDIVLIKGSASARMEQITKELMAEPLKAVELLVRQTG